MSQKLEKVWLIRKTCSFTENNAQVQTVHVLTQIHGPNSQRDANEAIVVGSWLFFVYSFLNYDDPHGPPHASLHLSYLSSFMGRRDVTRQTRTVTAFLLLLSDMVLLSFSPFRSFSPFFRAFSFFYNSRLGNKLLAFGCSKINRSGDKALYRRRVKNERRSSERKRRKISSKNHERRPFFLTLCLSLPLNFQLQVFS